MGLTHVPVRLRAVNGAGKTLECDFLVDTGATESLRDRNGTGNVVGYTSSATAALISHSSGGYDACSARAA